jgi:hypothetical protein
MVPQKINCMPVNLHYYYSGNIGGQEYIVPFNHDSSEPSQYSPPKTIL